MQARKLSYTVQTPEEMLRTRLHVHLGQDGGNPSQLLEMVLATVEGRVWEAFGMTFRKFIETPFDEGGVGWSIANLKTVLELRHRHEGPLTGHKDMAERLATMRQDVERLLMDDPNLLMTRSDAGKMGGRGNKASDNITSFTGRGTDPDYLTARIARDFPNILADMKAGKYKSVRAAALDAGIVKPRLSIPTDPTGAANAIIRNFNYDDLMTLINLLVEATQ